jgi:hypothetical protein
MPGNLLTSGFPLPVPEMPMLGIRIRMFLGLPDPDPLVRGTVRIRILPFPHKGVERTGIMLENKILHKILTKN